MPDIIVKQQPATSLTVQSNSTQLLIRQAAANNITVSTSGSSYVLPAATNSTLGGIIVGSNLTIANGVLSATSAGGGVTAFNNRTGNVTLTANDVSGLAFPLSSNATVTSGEKRVRGVVNNVFNGNGTYYPRDIYGITRNGTESGISYEYYIGTGYNGTLNPGSISTSGVAGIAVGFTSVNPAATPDYNQINQCDLTINTLGAYLSYTRRSDVPPFTSGNMITSILGCLQHSVKLERIGTIGNTFTWTSIEVYDGYIQITGQLKAISVKEITDQSEYLTKYAADKLYQPLTRLN